MDPLSSVLYFGVPTAVGLVGLAAVKLHERSVPPSLELPSGSSGVMSDRSLRDITEGIVGPGASIIDVAWLLDIGLEPPAIKGLVNNGIDLRTVRRFLNPRETSTVDREAAREISSYLSRFLPGDETVGVPPETTSATEGPETTRAKAG